MWNGFFIALDHFQLLQDYRIPRSKAQAASNEKYFKSVLVATTLAVVFLNWPILYLMQPVFTYLQPTFSFDQPQPSVLVRRFSLLLC